MSLLVVSRQIDPEKDRDAFMFLGLPAYCETLSTIADSEGWNVSESGVTQDGAWIVLRKYTQSASAFPRLYGTIDKSDLIGRLAPEVVS